MITLHNEIIRCFAMNPDNGNYECERVFNLADNTGLMGLLAFVEAFRYKEVQHTIRTYEHGIPVITTYRDLIRYDVRAIHASKLSDDNGNDNDEN